MTPCAINSHPPRIHIHSYPCTEAGCHAVPDPSWGEGGWSAVRSIFISPMDASGAGDASFWACARAATAASICWAETGASDNAASNRKAHSVFFTHTSSLWISRASPARAQARARTISKGAESLDSQRSSAWRTVGRKHEHYRMAIGREAQAELLVGSQAAEPRSEGTT